MVQQRSTLWWSKPHDSDATLSPLNAANSTTVTELKIKTGHFGTQLHAATKFAMSHRHAFRKRFCKKVWPLMYDCPLLSGTCRKPCSQSVNCQNAQKQKQKDQRSCSQPKCRWQWYHKANLQPAYCSGISLAHHRHRLFTCTILGQLQPRMIQP